MEQRVEDSRSACRRQEALAKTKHPARGHLVRAVNSTVLTIIDFAQNAAPLAQHLGDNAKVIIVDLQEDIFNRFQQTLTANHERLLPGG